MTRDPDARKELAEQARALYEDEGLTLMQVATRLKVSYGKAHALVKEAGGQTRKRGGSHLRAPDAGQTDAR